MITSVYHASQRARWDQADIKDDWSLPPLLEGEMIMEEHESDVNQDEYTSSDEADASAGGSEQQVPSLSDVADDAANRV